MAIEVKPVRTRPERERHGPILQNCTLFRTGIDWRRTPIPAAYERESLRRGGEASEVACCAAAKLRVRVEMPEPPELGKERKAENCIFPSRARIQRIRIGRFCFWAEEVIRSDASK